MNRIKMLEKARERAHEMIDDSSALSDEYFAELKGLPEDTAVEKLAYEFLTEAVADNLHEDAEEDEDLEFEEEESDW